MPEIPTSESPSSEPLTSSLRSSSSLFLSFSFFLFPTTTKIIENPNSEISQLGAYPVFVLDGIPSRLKSRARIERFIRATGVDLPDRGDAVSVERNGFFRKCIQECVVSRRTLIFC